MHNWFQKYGILTLLTSTLFAASQKVPETAATIVVVFRDGHQQTFSMSDVARIEFPSSAVSLGAPLPAHFLGKWEVDDGSGGTFFITLSRDGDAKKSIGAKHGTWTVVNGEARLTWDDGWHDVIRKAGDGYEKAAFAPGKTFSDAPSNVGNAKNTDPI